MTQRSQHIPLNKEATLAFVALAMTGISVASIGKAMVTPFHLMMIVYMGYVALFAPKANLGLMMSLLALGGFFLLNNIINYPDIRPTSLIYSMAFVLEMLLLYNFIKRCDAEMIKRIMGIILILYAVNIMLAFVALQLGFSRSLMGGLIGITQTTAGSRPCGFSSEPSYAAFILSIAFISFNRLNGYKIKYGFKRLGTAYFLCIMVLGSAYGMILMLIVLMDMGRHYFGILHASLKLTMLFGVVLFSIISANVLQNSNNESIVRLWEVNEVLFHDKYTTTEKKMIKLKEVDPSAFARIGTTYFLFRDETDMQSLMLGKGAGAAGVYIPKVMAGFLIDEDDEEFDTGIIPAFIFDYGFIGMALLLIFAISCFRGLPFPFWLMFIFLLPNANINTQLFWFMMASFLAVSLFGGGRSLSLSSSLSLKQGVAAGNT